MSLLSDVLSIQATKEQILNTCAILVADLETGEIYLATVIAEKMFGYLVLGEMKGMNVVGLMAHEMQGIYTSYRDAYIKDQTLWPAGKAKVVQGQKKDGTTFPVVVSLHAAVIEEKRCVIATVMDISPNGASDFKI